MNFEFPCGLGLSSSTCRSEEWTHTYVNPEQTYFLIIAYDSKEALKQSENVFRGFVQARILSKAGQSKDNEEKGLV